MMNSLKTLMLFRQLHLVQKADHDTKIEDIKKKIPNHDKHITTN